MSTRSLDVIGRIYRGLAGDGTDVFELLDADIEWVTPSALPWTVPGSDGHYVGHRQLRTYFSNCLAQVDDLQVEVDELVPADGRVLMVGHERGTSRETGRTFDARCAHLWVVQDGKAARLEGFIDTSIVALAFE